MLLTTLAFAQGMANIMENLDYQIVGILVVMMCLGGLAVILTISGSIAASIQNKAKAKAAAASAAPAPVPAAAPAAAGKPGMTPEMLAILSAAVDSAMTELTPEMVAVISAAVSHRIVEIKQSPGSGYAAAGRAEIFASHRIRPSH